MACECVKAVTAVDTESDAAAAAAAAAAVVVVVADDELTVAVMLRSKSF